MKYLIIALFALNTFSTEAKEIRTEIVDCQVAKMIDDGEFEEGLSRHEYPDVSVTRIVSGKKEWTELHFGSMRTMSTKKGDLILQAKSPLRTVFVGNYKDSKWRVIVDVSNKPSAKNKRWGYFRYREDKSSKAKDLALLICK